MFKKSPEPTKKPDPLNPETIYKGDIVEFTGRRAKTDEPDYDDFHGVGKISSVYKRSETRDTSAEENPRVNEYYEFWVNGEKINNFKAFKKFNCN